MSKKQHAASIPTRAGLLQFRLRSLLLIMTWIGLSLSLARAMPVLGGIAAALTVPAFARTWMCVWQSESVAGIRVSTAEMVETFLYSVSLQVMVVVAWLIVSIAAFGVAVSMILATCSCLCQYAATASKSVVRRSERLLRAVVLAIQSQMVPVGRPIRRRKGVARWLWAVVRLPGIAICASIAVSLAVVTAIAAPVGLLCGLVGRLGRSFYWTEGKVVHSLHLVLGWKTHLLRQFRTPRDHGCR